MMIVRAKRKTNYTIISNVGMEDVRLTFKAKGILAYLLSKPDNWQVRDRQLATVGPDGRAAVQAALRELEKHGYIKRIRERNEQGQWAYTSYVYDEPWLENPSTENPSTENPSTENPSTENPAAENPAAENQAITSTEETSTEETSTEEEAREANASPPTPAPPGKKGAKIIKSPHFSNEDFEGMYIPAGQGQNPVQVYYERFNIFNPDERLTVIKEDDLNRQCPDLERLREVVTAYSRTAYKPGNIGLILDWYHAGVRQRGASRAGRGGQDDRTNQMIDNVAAQFRAQMEATGTHYGQP